MADSKEQEVVELIANALEIDAKSLTLESTSNDVEEWDSLGHLGILADLDKFYDGKISGIREMAQVDSIGKMLQLLKDNSLL
jgi:acyl carrier protein|tara:strand:+ start:880 stop:1125 length:246 start_codon:yes stop_codon:yes gene_type:complete